MRSAIIALGFAAAAAGIPAPAHERIATAAKQATLPAAARDAAAVVDAFHSALHRGDTSAAAALLADDALIFEAGGAERSKTEYAAHHLPADAEFSKAVSSSMIRRAGDAGGTLAWIASEGRSSGTFKGEPVDSLTAETMVLRRAGGDWKIVHIHWSSAKR